MWIQWLLYEQFRNVKKYTNIENVLIKGDLPVLVSRDSADVWAHPEYFKMEYAAGAPPDVYIAVGQRWGMPTYNWDKIAEDDFNYIKKILKKIPGFDAREKNTVVVLRIKEESDPFHVDQQIALKVLLNAHSTRGTKIRRIEASTVNPSSTARMI